MRTSPSLQIAINLMEWTIVFIFAVQFPYIDRLVRIVDTNADARAKSGALVGVHLTHSQFTMAKPICHIIFY